MRSANPLQDFAVSRAGYALLALGVAGLLGFAYYLQFSLGEDPCPLCIFQRVAYFAAGVVALVATLHGSRGVARRFYSSLIGLAGLSGFGIAARQTWLQHLPKDLVPECGPGLSFMLEHYAAFDILQKVLRGSGECAEVGWTFLGFSIAEWSLLCFASLVAYSVLQLLGTRRHGWD